jgi:large subunit ribosomal protein L13
MVEAAVKGMLPKSRLGRQLFTNMRVYANTEHPHTAQQPEIVEIL